MEEKCKYFHTDFTKRNSIRFKTAIGLHVFFFWQFSGPRNSVNPCNHLCSEMSSLQSELKLVQEQQKPQRTGWRLLSVRHAGENLEQVQLYFYLCAALMTHSAAGFSWMRSFIYVSLSRHLSSEGRKTKTWCSYDEDDELLHSHCAFLHLLTCLQTHKQ